jgi:type I restriction enzyme S subunit
MSTKWPKVRLGDVLRLDLDRVPVDASTNYPMVGVLSFGRGLFNREPVENGQTSYKYFYRLKADHIVMSQLFGWEGALALSSDEFAGKFLSPQFPTFLCDETKLRREFLGWIMRRPAFWEDLGSRASGMGDRRRTLNPEALFACDTPLPPMAEQQRIVAKIDQLATKIAEARGLRGHLVNETDSLIPSALKHLPLPVSSRVTNIAACSRMSTGTTPPSSREDYFCGPISWYTPGDLNFSMKLAKSSRTITETAVRDGKARIFEPNTVLLVAIGGSLGKVALTHERCSTNQQITGIKFDNEILPEYGFWWVRRLGKDLMAAAPQATLPIINQERLGAFEIVIPPLYEQHRIVSRLNDLQAKVDAITHLQAETTAELDALLPSILDKAFKREL